MNNNKNWNKKLGDDYTEELWDQFKNIPTNEDNTIIEEKFHIWSVGTAVNEIWNWFDKKHSYGLCYLMYERE